MSAKNVSIIAAAAASLGARGFILNQPSGEVKLEFHRLLDEKAKLRDGSEGEYILVKKPGSTDEATMLKLSPKQAHQLFDGKSVPIPSNGANKDYAGSIKLEPEADNTTQAAAGQGDDEKAKKAAEKQAAKDKAAADRKAAKDKKAAEKAEKKAAREKEAADRKAKKDALKAKQEAKAKDKEANSKKTKALAIYNSVPADDAKRRQKVIAKLCAVESEGGLDMSPAGANTYYQNMKSGHWK